MRTKLRLVFLRSGNLICSSFAIAREFDFRVACRNIRSFQISDKSGCLFGQLQESRRGPAAYSMSVSNLSGFWDAIDFKGGGSRSGRAAEELWDEQMFEFGASHNASAFSDAPLVSCRYSVGSQAGFRNRTRVSGQPMDVECSVAISACLSRVTWSQSLHLRCSRKRSTVLCGALSSKNLLRFSAVCRANFSLLI